MSLALPPAPAPRADPGCCSSPRRSPAPPVGMLFAGMLAVWIALRDAAGGTTAAWLPKGIVLPGVASNMMLIIMVGRLGDGAVGGLRHGPRQPP